MSEIPPRLFLVKYNDYTLDVIALYPDEIEKVRTMKGVNILTAIGDDTELMLDRDYLFSKKYREKDEDDDD